MRRLIWAGVVLGVAMAQPAQASIILDFETPGTGLNLNVAPLLTPYGTITASASGLSSLLVFPEAATGLSGNFLLHYDGANVNEFGQLAFDFDVSSITFRWAGRITGVITVEAMDAAFTVLDSFFDGNTTADLPGGPTTLSGPNIRYLRFGDYPGGQLQVALDDIEIVPEAVPEPATLLLLGGGLAGLAARRRKMS